MGAHHDQIGRQRPGVFENAARRVAFVDDHIGLKPSGSRRRQPPAQLLFQRLPVGVTGRNLAGEDGNGYGRAEHNRRVPDVQGDDLGSVPSGDHDGMFQRMSRDVREVSRTQNAAYFDHDNLRRRALQLSCSDARSFLCELTIEADHGIVRCRLIGTGSRAGSRRLSRQLAAFGRGTRLAVFIDDIGSSWRRTGQLASGRPPISHAQSNIHSR